MSDEFRHKISKMVSDTGHRLNSWDWNIKDIQKILDQNKMLEALVKEAFIESQRGERVDDYSMWSWDNSETKKKLEGIRKIK